MKNFIVLVICFISSYAVAENNQQSISKIYKADTNTVSGNIVRYYQTLDDPCIKVQILKAGGAGLAVSSLDFCSISGKSFNADFAETWLEKGEFTDSELVLTLRLIPLRLTKDEIQVCKFSVENGELSGPHCTGE